MKIKLLFFLVFHGLLFTLSAQSDPDPDDSDLPTPDVSSSFCKDPFCGGAEIHPNDSDWIGDDDNKHKIIISTSDTDNEYYTDYQTADRTVQIVVRYPEDANNSLVGRSVTFTVVDPDDKSPYEPDKQGDDNLDPNNKYGTLSQSSVDLTLDPNDPTMVIAQTTLTITDQYSGDNYIVEANLDGWCALKTSLLVAWKRIYIEKDRMYSEGAYFSSNYSDNSPSVERITFDGENYPLLENLINIRRRQGLPLDFTVFSPDGDLFNTRVVGVIRRLKKIIFSDFPGQPSIEKHYGIRPADNSTLFDVSPHLLTNAYGGDGGGLDGGAFTEFKLDGVSGTGVMPFSIFKWDTIRQYEPTVNFMNFSNYWSPNSLDNSNIIHVIACSDHMEGVALGWTAETDAILYDFSGIKTPLNNNTIILNHKPFRPPADTTGANYNMFNGKAEVLAHEVAHVFEVSHGHIDQNISVRSHDDRDDCLVTYTRDHSDNIAEFDSNYVSNPLESCARQIRQQNEKL